jgi:stage V sporulation protein K
MDSSDNSGEQVIATLIKQMEDQRGRFILIIAGYTNEMRQLIETNPGFESRIKEYLHFPDYNSVEMREIFCYMANKKNFVVDTAALGHYDAIVEKERKLKSFGNGRTARNILDKVIDKHTLNLATGILKPEDRYRLCSQDFQNIKLGGIGFDKNW